MSDKTRLGILISDELLSELDKLFPDRCARPGLSLEQIWIEAGQRQVIRLMQAAKEEADQNILNH